MSASALTLLSSPVLAVESRIALTYVHHNEPEWQAVWNNQAAYLAYRDTLTQLVAGEVADRLKAEARPTDHHWAYSEGAVNRALRGED